MQSDGPESPPRIPVSKLPRENCRKLHFGAELIREQTSAMFSLQVNRIYDGVPPFCEHVWFTCVFAGTVSAKASH